MHWAQYVVSEGLSPLHGGPAMNCPGEHAILQLAHCLSNWVLPVQKPRTYSPAGGVVAAKGLHLPLQGEHALSEVGPGRYVHSVLMYCPFSPAE